MTNVKPSRDERIPQAGKYSFWELERRFVLDALPPVFVCTAEIDVHDRYIRGTRLRLRRLVDRATGEVSLKLAQKLVPDADDFARVEMTNMYLAQSDYDVLAALPADVLVKVRKKGTLDDVACGIDLFAVPHAGLVIATVDFDDDAAMRAWIAPPSFGREVSHDVAYTGAALARAAS